MIGGTLEHYRIEAKLGEGGMGVVYKGHDPRLDRAVAIKVLPPDKLADPVARERFVREARAASALNHPAIVTIHDIRSADGVDFIVMEYVQGQTLDALMRSRRLRIADLLRYAIQITDAMAAAHSAGILHRDLKPSNLMVTPEGRIKVLDFGLAKLVEPSGDGSEAPTVAAITADRALLGTPAYMSPEQAEGRPLDARSDIFSFGAVLYEMVTGVRAFTGDSHVSVLSRVLTADPPAPSDIASVPAELSKITLRCLRKDPGRRYQSMADLKIALDDVESGAGPSRARVSPAWTWAVLVVMAAAAAAGYIGWQRTPSAPPEPLRAVALTTTPGAELYPSLSPDGDRVVFTWSGPKQDNTNLWVQQIGAGSPLQLTTDARTDYNPVWSPDGRWIAFLRGDPERSLGRSERELRLIAPLGGPERKLADLRVQEITVNPSYLAWCPDSTCLIATDSMGDGKPDGLFVIALETGDKRPLTTPASPVLADTNPAMSPDGQSLLFLRRTTWSLGQIHVAPLQKGTQLGGEPRHIGIGTLYADNATWLPDGHEILFATPLMSGGARLWKVAASGSGPPSQLPYVGEDGVMPIVSQARGGTPARLIYVRSFTDENIWRLDLPDVGTPAASPPTRAVASTKADIHPQFSPDGSRVAFTSTRSGAWEIWVSDLDGSNASQLTSLTAPTGTGAPRWSPDGQLIAFASDAEGQFDIFVVPAAGGKPRNITSHPSFDHVPAFSRDGKWLYFSSARSGEFQVWKVPVSGGTPQQITRNGGWISEESPDGTFLYFSPTAAIGAPTALWRMPTTGGDAVRVVDRMMNAPFVIHGAGIFYLDEPGSNPRLQFYDLRQQQTVTLANLGDFPEIGGLDVSPNGRVVLIARRDSAVDDLMLVENFR
jgi:Tol biopolymer transport system component/tRNA A-37 threonylcarbamoyl transferase component Bud32